MFGGKAQGRRSIDLFRNTLHYRREELLDFADRYERGASYDDISEKVAVTRYREVVPELCSEDYRHSAREAFSRMKQEERAELGKQLRNQPLQQGYEFPEPSADDRVDRYQAPDYLTDLTACMRREHPNLLEGLVGDGGAGLVGGMLGEGSTDGEGVARDGGMLGDLVAKAALADIATMGFKKIADGR